MTTERHKAWVEKLVASVEGGAGALHDITEPLSWRSFARITEDFFGDAQPLRRVELRRLVSRHARPVLRQAV